METNLRNTIKLTITGNDLATSNKKSDIKSAQTLIIDEGSALQQGETSKERQSKNTEPEIVKDLLEKLPETIT
jgi:hypothetical protein